MNKNLIDLPLELLDIIKKCVINNNETFESNYNSLINLRETCKQLNKLIPVFDLSKYILEYNLQNYKAIEYCININCYNDTLDFFEEIVYNNYRKYIHHHQPALNRIIIPIHEKKCIIHSPYCELCFRFHCLKDKTIIILNHLQFFINRDNFSLA